MSAIYYEALELIKNLQAENARLKAEVDRLAMSEGYHYTAVSISTLKEQLHQKHLDYIEARKANEAKVEIIKSLKADVERLIWASQGSVKYVDHTMALARQATKHHKEIESLEAQVERLTKAGNELEKRYFEYATPDDAVKAWHAAKGVQS